MNDNQKRRTFLKASAIGALSASVAPQVWSDTASKPAVLGGKPVRNKSFTDWPMIQENDRRAWEDVLEKKGWCRLNGDYAKTFEKKYAELTGAKECLAVANGTSALFTSLNALDVGPGDEVLVSPYTFVATVNTILLQHAIPVFVDTDRETFQLDADKIEEKITDRTRCIMPVHIGGYPADMGTIMKIAKKHNLPVIEDACQAHMAEWEGKKVGSIGDTGCFSFQVTKNLSGGEGGAILCSNQEVMDRCYSFHSNGRERTNTYGYRYIHNGSNVRMTEFQAALLLEQMTRLEEQSKRRSDNADYLTSLLEEIPGIKHAKFYDGVTQCAYHLYMMSYDPEGFSGLPRNKFISALREEGITAGNGYSPLNKEPFLKDAMYSRGYQNIYGKEYIDQWFANNELPENDKLCEEAVWFYQFMLLGDRSDMDQIAEAIKKIHTHAEEIKKA